MKQITLFILLALSLLSEKLYAEIKLPAIVGSNMVLQRNTTVALWGWADAREKFQIQMSWIEEPISVKANDKGNWQLEVATTDSKEPQWIRFESRDTTFELQNILFGEVWLCSGQTNMVQPVKGFDGQPTYGANEAIAKSANENLRLFVVPAIGAKSPQSDVGKASQWKVASHESVWKFSAIGYFYGRQLQQVLDVPVGLIQSARGGSRVEAWMSREVLSPYRKVDIEDANMAKARLVPTALFNGMINPIIPYTIKGTLWYQGESNRGAPDTYKKIFPELVKDWRERWGQGDTPFYFVQIAPYFYGDQQAYDKPENSAYMREAQLECVDLILNSGIAIALDAGDEYCIHPPFKKEVADRIFYLALNQTYGYENVDGKSPVYADMEVGEGKIIVKFKELERGLYTYDSLENFEIAGADKVFYPAKAKIINRREVLIESKQVPDPVAVRYAWSNWVKGTLYEDSMLPVSSFRTDDWDNATRAKQ